MNYIPINLSDLNEIIKNYNWSLNSEKNKITKKYEFFDFKKSFGFMTQVALEAEKRNHHPEWFNVYNQLTISWSTHELNGLSCHDFEMAKYCDKIYENYFDKEQ